MLDVYKHAKLLHGKMLGLYVGSLSIARARLEWIYLSFDVATHTQQLAHNLQHQTRTTPRLMLSIHNHPTLRGENGRCAMYICTKLFCMVQYTHYVMFCFKAPIRFVTNPWGVYIFLESLLIEAVPMKRVSSLLLHTVHTLQLEWGDTRRVDTWTQNNLGDFKQFTLNISAYLIRWWYE